MISVFFCSRSTYRKSQITNLHFHGLFTTAEHILLAGLARNNIINHSNRSITVKLSLITTGGRMEVRGNLQNKSQGLPHKSLVLVDSSSPRQPVPTTKIKVFCHPQSTASLTPPDSQCLQSPSVRQQFKCSSSSQCQRVCSPHQ